MDKLEASVEILKIVISHESFKDSAFPEKTSKILESFREIYKQVSEITVGINQENEPVLASNDIYEDVFISGKSCYKSSATESGGEDDDTLDPKAGQDTQPGKGKRK